MLNLSTSIILSTEQKTLIKNLGKLTPEKWEKNETKLRKKISSDLIDLQNDLCVYCGCKAWRAGDVDHIAHKAKYAQFMFTPKNLAYSCKMCNQKFKGKEDVVIKTDPDYEECEFSIVHPYLDDVEYYFDTKRPIISINKSLTKPEMKKARKTYSLFRWDSPEVTERRAEQILAENKAKEMGKTISQIAIENTLTYNA